MADSKKPLPRRRLRVTKLEKVGEVKNGKNAGNPIYAVSAVKEDGSPVEQELRSFAELPIGEVVEYALSRYEHEKYGVTFTLYPPKESRGKLTERVTELEKRVATLESRLGDSPPTSSTESSTATAAVSGTTHRSSDDDIPF